MFKPADRKRFALATVFLPNLLATRRVRGDKGGLEGDALDAAMLGANALRVKADRLARGGSKGVACRALFLENLWVVLALRAASN